MVFNYTKFKWLAIPVTDLAHNFFMFHHQQMIKWFEKHYLFGKNQVVDLSKLSLVCSIIISGAWYAFHTLAEAEWRHNYVAIATGGSELGGAVTTQVQSLMSL